MISRQCSSVSPRRESPAWAAAAASLRTQHERVFRGLRGSPGGPTRLQARPALGRRSAVWTAFVFLSHQLPLAWPCAGNHNRGIHQDFPLNQGLKRSRMFQDSLPDPSDPKARAKEKRVQAVTSSVLAGTWSQGGGRRARTTRQAPPSKPLVLGGPSSLHRDGAAINTFSDFLYFLKFFWTCMHCFLNLSFSLHGVPLLRGGYSSCGAWASHCDGSSCFPCSLVIPLLQALGHAGYRTCSTKSQHLQLLGLAAPQQVESSQTRDRTHVPRTGRWILIHWTTREVPVLYFQMLRHPGALGTYGDSPLRASCLPRQQMCPL